MKTVRSYGNVAEAGFAQSLLRAAGIDASLIDENAATIGLDIRLQAPDEDVELALEILDGKAGLNPQSPGHSLGESAPVKPEIEAPAAKEDMSLNITCPNCGTAWELTPDEGERSEFTCQECKTTFPINPDLRHDGPRALKVIRVFSLVAVTLITLGIGVHFVGGFFPSDLYAYYRRGVSRQHNGNLDGALADFNSSIELSSRNPAAYCARGAVKLAKGDLDGAMADENQAITLDPQKPQPYYYRGRVKMAVGDFAGAVADDNQAIVLEPNKPFAYVGRGHVKVANGDFDGAMADDNQAIAINPKYAYAYNSRGNTNVLKRKWAAALADYRQCCDLSPNGQDYPRLYIYLIRARLGEREAARKELSAYFGNRKKTSSGSGDWVATIAGYLLGSVTEADFFAAAGSPNERKSHGQTSEAWYYAGIEKLLDGDRKAAAEYLQKCIATKETDYVEYGLAQSEVKALGE